MEPRTTLRSLPLAAAFPPLAACLLLATIGCGGGSSLLDPLVPIDPVAPTDPSQQSASGTYSVLRFLLLPEETCSDEPIGRIAYDEIPVEVDEAEGRVTLYPGTPDERVGTSGIPGFVGNVGFPDPGDGTGLTAGFDVDRQEFNAFAVVANGPCLDTESWRGGLALDLTQFRVRAQSLLAGRVALEIVEPNGAIVSATNPGSATGNHAVVRTTDCSTIGGEETITYDGAVRGTYIVRARFEDVCDAVSASVVALEIRIAGVDFPVIVELADGETHEFTVSTI